MINQYQLKKILKKLETQYQELTKTIKESKDIESLEHAEVKGCATGFAMALGLLECELHKFEKYECNDNTCFAKGCSNKIEKGEVYCNSWQLGRHVFLWFTCFSLEQPSFGRLQQHLCSWSL